MLLGPGAVPDAAAGDATRESGVAGLQSAIFAARDKVLPALVNVQPISEVFAGGHKRRRTSVGSGVIFSPKGYAITNYHVAGKAKQVICTLADRERVSAKTVGGDPITDIAVIKLNLAELKGKALPRPAELGDSGKLEMGHFVIALGSPLALARSMSFGVVSNPRRYLSPNFRLPTGEPTGALNTWIQTDAAINPGNSGGPLVDLNGRVVGINARIIGFANNLGFAIPIDVVKDVANQLIAKGRVSRSWIGTEFQSLERLRIPSLRGVLVRSVVDRSPASAAGIRAGDLILRYDGTPVSARFDEELPAVSRLIADTPIGKKVELLLQRGPRRLTLSLVTEDLGRLLGSDMECADWGFTVKGITDQMVRDQRLKTKEGVFVSGVENGGPAAVGGLITGDVITTVGGKGVAGLSAFEAIYAEWTKDQKRRTLLKVDRNGSVKFILIKLRDRMTVE